MDNTAKNAELDHNTSLLLQKALMAGKEELFQVMQEQAGEVLLAALRNPALDENHLLTLLKRRGLPEELFTTFYSGKRLLESYKVKVAVVCHPDNPPHVAQTLLSQLYIFDLAKISSMPGTNADLRLAAERYIIKLLPTQPLGNKLALARRGTSAVVEALLREGIPSVVEACLENPHLKEGAVHQFIASYQSSAETISMVARSTRWKGRPNIRLVILKNPRTPTIWFTTFLPGLSPQAIRELLTLPRLTMAQKEVLRQALNSKGLHS
jgi:hypothetical protein